MGASGRNWIVALDINHTSDEQEGDISLGDFLGLLLVYAAALQSVIFGNEAYVSRNGGIAARSESFRSVVGGFFGVCGCYSDFAQYFIVSQ